MDRFAQLKPSRKCARFGAGCSRVYIRSLRMCRLVALRVSTLVTDSSVTERQKILNVYGQYYTHRIPVLIEEFSYRSHKPS